MRKFIYEAKDGSTGKVVKAAISAETERAAAKILLKQGFTPLSIKEQESTSSTFSRLRNRVSVKDKVVFTRQLSTLIAAGLPLSQSLRTVVEQTPNVRLKSVLQDVIESIEGGRSLHDSFAKHPGVFDKLFLALVAVGESSGTLDEALQRVAAQQEKDAAILGKIRGAMTYPVIVLFVIFGVLGFMLLTVVPQVEKLYKDLDKELPLLTQLMVSASNFLINFWWLVLIVIATAVYFAVRYIKTPAGIRTYDSFKLNVPIFGGMFQKLYMARFNRTGQTLLESGVAMLDMLKITSEAVSNTLISESILRASEKVRGGKALSVTLKSEDHFPVLVSQMIKIGEQSGRIDEMMGKTATIYEDELDEQIRTISTAIEPVLMVVLAIAAGGMVAAILLPIYGLVGNMG
ncbi:TPA: type II secretion system F family protein [Candidatus Saccharibacteria bacterium]|nr:MAG: putative Type IV pilus assembly protein PilC [Candidatus Saccharibacteria bacterium GW2011_GWC2_44_17]MBH1956699.1 type II secretion system F family protein [Candidatus Saccharibacteria bacterium]OGL23835.1 MAG: pilus assembly protein PilC [Candidatus Saccharibacteria bacterium RIFCSPHIGHO2_01_FULL_46_30]OGL33480.1 MAG: pilus assembly protein PilC [Candidatus Saccharibacteria bacterium RIFCSPHIGHO2_12_FULL_47_16]MBH1973087.1 type II secretion system F family protein [Candidatus Sacchari